MDTSVQPPQRTYSRTHLAGASISILIVDDDPLIRRLWRDTLSRAAASASFVEVNNGATAIKTAASLQPDVILMDILMSGMSGLDATKELKASTKTSRIPVIAVTGSAFSMQEVLDAGCDGYLVKPIEAQTLVQEIARLLQLRSS